MTNFIWAHRIAIVFFLFVGTTAPTRAQPATEAPPVAAEDPTETPTAPDQIVAVNDTTSDQRIADRLQGILESTGWYTNPTVTVDNGVAFLNGQTDGEEYRKWARELALKTEGVVAAVNKIRLREGPMWDVTPAKREVRNLSRQVAQALPLVVIGLVILAITLLLSRAIAKLATIALVGRMQNAILRGVIEKALMVLVIIIGTVIFLRITGLTRVAMTLLGGTGVAGLILGFAFRDIAENFLASLLISIQRPFRVGDTITVDSYTGVVQRVTTRGTLLMDFDGNHIQIANSVIYKSTIRNFTANPNRRLNFAVGIGYDADVAQAQQTILKVLETHSAVLGDPAPNVLVESLGASTINMRIYYWIDGSAHSHLKVNSAIMRLALRALEDAEISLPDEARELVFPQPVPVQMLEQSASPTVAPPSRPVHKSAENEESTAGEGNLASESADIEKQSREAPSPEDGANLLTKEDV